MPDETYEPRIREWVNAYSDYLRATCAKSTDDSVLDWRHVDRVALWMATLNGWHPPTPRREPPTDSAESVQRMRDEEYLRREKEQ